VRSPYLSRATAATIKYGWKIANPRSTDVIEPLVLGITLGLIPITLAGLFVAAYLQYKRGNQFGLD